MNLMIRIPLPVENLNALAGFYTDGPSMMALYGLVSQLESDAQVTVSRFGLVVEEYESRLHESLVSGLDATERLKQRSGSTSQTGYRYANMRAALYLETDADALDGEAELLELLSCLELSINACRVQGGNLVEYISADPKMPVRIETALIRTDADRVAFLFKHEKPLSTLYLSKHLPNALRGDALVDAFADALVRKDVLMVCHGYIKVGSVQDAYGQSQNIGEPSYTLVEPLQMYALRKLEVADQAAALTRFFWSFDQERHAANPNHLFLV
jgi:hypothetical protein